MSSIFLENYAEGSDSEGFVIKSSALAELPECTHLIATNDKAIKL
jgi:hypothetical protein